MASIGDSSNLSEGSGVTENDIDIANPKLGMNIRNVMGKLSCLTCVTHSDENILFYCEDHRVDCCVVCIAETHTECSSVPIEDIYLKCYSYIDSVKLLSNNIQSEENNLWSYLRRLKNYFRLGENEIKILYDKVRKMVDEAEKTTLKKFEAMKEGKLTVMSSHFKEYEELKKKIKNILEEGKRLHNDIVKQYDNVTSAKSRKKIKLSCYIEKHMNEIERYNLAHDNDMEIIKGKLNELTEVVKDTNMDFVNKKSQQMLTIESSLDDIVSIEGVRSSSSPTQYLPDGQISCQGNVYSMCTIPNKKDEMLIVTYSPNRLQHINSQGTVIKYVDLSGQPFDICMHASNIAVAIYNKNQIVCYRESDLGLNSTLNLPSACSGVCRARDLFVVSFCNERIVRSVNDNGQIIRSSGNNWTNPRVVRYSEHSKCILVSEWSGTEVSALSLDLTTVMFKLSHADLQSPNGLDVNECGGVYVCSYNKHCIVEFTKDGKYKSTILPAGQLGINYPYSLCYDAANRCLYAASQNNVMRKYKGQ